MDTNPSFQLLNGDPCLCSVLSHLCAALHQNHNELPKARELQPNVILFEVGLLGLSPVEAARRFVVSAGEI